MNLPFQLPPLENMSNGIDSLHLELILEPQPQPHDHLALESYDRLALEPHDHCNLSLALNTSASQEGPSPQLRPSSEPPIPFHTFLQQLRHTALRRNGMSLNLRINRRRHLCSICQEVVVEKSVVHNLHCRHTFHRNCLQKWAKKHDSCPLCRQQLI